MLMSAENVGRTIQLIIAPVVLITACALIQNAVLLRYAGVGQYMRSIALERLQLLRSEDVKDKYYLERLQEIDRQIPLLTRRHQLVQKTVMVIYGAMITFLSNMFAIALAVALNATGVATFALILFLLGTALLLLGVCLTALEIRMSHHAICYEVGRIASLM